MPKINVAFCLEGPNPGSRIADKSKTNIRKRLREMPGTAWRVCHYVLESGVPTLCQAIEDITKIPPAEVEDVRINDSGQVRSVS